jgi:hypothetical protein
MTSAPVEFDCAGCFAAEVVQVPVLVEERDRREESASSEGLGPPEWIGESQFQVYVIKIDAEPIGECGDSGSRGCSRAQCECVPIPCGCVERSDPRDAARVQADGHSGPVSVGVLIHAAKSHNDSTGGGVGEAPEPPLHPGTVRRQRIPVRRLLSADRRQPAVPQRSPPSGGRSDPRAAVSGKACRCGFRRTVITGCTHSMIGRYLLVPELRSSEPMLLPLTPINPPSQRNLRIPASSSGAEPGRGLLAGESSDCVSVFPW